MNKPHVGILSMQRVINYGSFLQAYGLKQLLLANGAESVSFIDIIPGRRLTDTKPVSTARRLAKEMIGGLLHGTLIQHIRTHLFNRKLTKTIAGSWPMLELDNPQRREGFDLAVIGSDEVFNCVQESPWGYTTQLYGDIAPTTAKATASYAASFGFTDLAQLRAHGIDGEVGRLIGSMKAVSVRDDNSRAIVKELTGKQPELHLDPVLIYGYRDEIAAFDPAPLSDEKYMVVYTYAERIKSKEEIRAIKNYAKANGLKIYTIFCDYTWADRAVLPSTPIEALRWFKGAECVVTDTFHGTIFSIITHSRFATFIRPSNRNKLTSLLSGLTLGNRAVGDMKELGRVLDQSIDYTAVETALDAERHKANEYLKRCLCEA